MLMKVRIVPVLLFLAMLACGSFPAYAGSPGRLAIVSVSNETEEPEFNNLLIAQGIASLVAQEFYDTGRFVPVEDNPEITKRISDLMTLSVTDRKQVDSTAIRKQLGCEAIAYARVKRFSKSRMRGFAGPFSGSNVNIEMDVEVTLQEGERIALTSMGSSTATTKARGILFEVRNDKIHFDKTSVGLATQDAVRQAIKKMFEKKEDQ